MRDIIQFNQAPTISNLRNRLSEIADGKDAKKALDDFVDLKDVYEKFELDYNFELKDFLDSAQPRFFDQEDIDALQTGDAISYYQVRESAPYYTHNDAGQAVNLTMNDIKETLNHVILHLDEIINAKPYVLEVRDVGNLVSSLFNMVTTGEKRLDDMIINCKGRLFNTFSYGHEMGSDLPASYGIAHYLDTKTGSYLKVTYELNEVKPNQYKGIKDIHKVELI